MGHEAVLRRVEADLGEAQAEIETATTAEDSLGDSLKFGFGALFAAVHQLIAGFSQQRGKVEDIDARLKEALWRISQLEKNVHGLKVSRGKAVAAKNRALAIIVDARGTLDTITLN